MTWLREGEVATRPPVPEIAQARKPSIEQCAKETFNFPAEWQFSSLESKGDRETGYTEIKGGVYKTLISRGARKGQTDFRKPEPGTEATVAVTWKAFTAWLRKWEEETGLCNECHGTGYWLSGMGVSGEKYRPCKPCGQTGKAPAGQALDTGGQS